MFRSKTTGANLPYIYNIYLKTVLMFHTACPTREQTNGKQRYDSYGTRTCAVVKICGKFFTFQIGT